MTTNNVVALPQAAPPIPWDQMQRLAEAIARSGLFGIRTADQALALMSIAQAEGRHPATVARDYHIISGAPAKKSEAMLRDFLSAGGRVEWHRLDDEAAEATFSHPTGGAVRISWDQARVARAQLGANAMHKKYPRQMLRSRVVSEGVRTVFPLATSGFYVPEEMAEIARVPAPVIDTRGDLDAFAAPPPPSLSLPHEAVREEERQGDERHAEAVRLMEIDARAAAAQGTDALRAHLGSLSKPERAMLADLVGSRDEPGELLRLARASDQELQSVEADGVPEERLDAFGLPVTPPPRDEDWWAQDVLLVESADPREFQQRLHQRIREARSVGDVEILRASNPRIDELDRSRRESILGELADRERELRGIAEN